MADCARHLRGPLPVDASGRSTILVLSGPVCAVVADINYYSRGPRHFLLLANSKEPKCGYRCVQYESIFGLAYGFAVVRHFYKPWCGTFDRIDIAQAVNKEQITKRSDRARSWAHRKFLLVTMLG